jgi:hypothetical protein
VAGLLYACGRRDCQPCDRRRRRETARVLLLDARDDPPTHALTLTTRDPDIHPETYRLGSAAVWKRLRRWAGEVDYFGSVEFTTGRARRSGGHRRMHGHYLVKGLGGEDVRLIEGLVRETWSAVTGAWVVEVAELVTPGAAIHYLNLHHSKAEQRPPAGWRGMVERPSRGYFRARRLPELREHARYELRAEAVCWLLGLEPRAATVPTALLPDGVTAAACPRGAPAGLGGDRSAAL